MSDKVIIIWLVVITLVLVINFRDKKFGKKKGYFLIKFILKNLLIIFGFLILLFSFIFAIKLDMNLEKLVDILVPLGTILLTIGLSNFFADKKDKAAIDVRKAEVVEEKYLQIEMSVRPIIDIHTPEDKLVIENIGVGNAIYMQAYDMDKGYEILSFSMTDNDTQYLNLKKDSNIEIPCFRKNGIDFEPRNIIFMLTNIMLTEIYFTTLEFEKNGGIIVSSSLYSRLDNEIKKQPEFKENLKKYAVTHNVSSSFIERYKIKFF